MKFSGMIGFLQDEVEVAPDVYKPQIIERPYKGDLLENRRRFSSNSEKQNDNIELSNRISILSDLYFQNNYHTIAYIKWNNVKWKCQSIDIGYHRVTLEIGGLYEENNGNEETEISG